MREPRIDLAGAKALADATDICWDAILAYDIAGFGASMRTTFEAQIAMFLHMMNDMMVDLIATYRDRELGWKLSGAGYLIFVEEAPVDGVK